MALFSCVVMGDESLTIECSKKLMARGHQIAALVTGCPNVTAWGSSQGLNVVTPGVDLSNRLPDTGVDWLFSIANLRMIPETAIAKATKGAINFHDGPLPRHAGLNAPVWALIEGETTHGVTWHMIEGGVDEGSIVAQASFGIDLHDTALTLNTKAYEAGLNSFSDVVSRLENNTLSHRVQDLSQRSYHALADRPHAGGILDVTRPAAELERMVRALDHGGYWNPLSLPKLMTQAGLYVISSATLCETQASVGTVLEIADGSVTVACDQGGLVLRGFKTLDGQDAMPNLAVGDVLPRIDAALFDDAMAQTARHDQHWRRTLKALELTEVGAFDGPQGTVETLKLGQVGLGQAAAFALHLTQSETCTLGYAHPALQKLAETGLIAPWIPVQVTRSETLDRLEQSLDAALTEAKTRVGFAADLMLRDPDLNGKAAHHPHIALSDSAGIIPGAALTIELGTEPCLHVDTARIPVPFANLLAERLNALSDCAGDTPFDALPRLSDLEARMLVHDWNATDMALQGPKTMYAAFEAQVAKTPHATAVVFEGDALSYDDLNARANRVAHALRTMGVGPDTVVGLYCRRSIDLLVGAIGILKAGGAYLPLDPAYPADRLQHYVTDSAASVIVTQSDMQASLPPHSAQVLALDIDSRIATAPSANPDPVSNADNLAYLIYTSGSTGLPKGVMVEHGNAINFFAGMDKVIPQGDAATWLAVTSLSFDISVLELFYTTARGFKVVLTSDEDRGMISNGPIASSDTNMEFSLYYWGNDDGVGRDKYRLLLEGAKFADANGFCAVWTPERHFHAFGGPYPNPSVTGAAVAAVTRNIGVRAGSVVSPLHHPARIAEEWAIIDNLTNGRAGLAMASGWQPDDFVLRPENTPPNNRAALTESVHQLRKLWAGEPVGFPKADGTLHEVITQPRPVSKNLPIWMTIAGNPETWREAGRLGCNVLTHLLGQSIDEVADKIKLYHQELRKAGHDPKDFTISMMLHTCIADTREAARDRAREPMKEYLRSAAGLIKQYAWAFPAFKRPKGVSNAFELDLGVLEGDELDQILDFAFERYFNDSGLFGTIEDALTRTEQLKRIGVGEIACLIDYGIDADEVLEGLTPLAQVVAQANETKELDADDFSIAAQIIRHEVTHLQCTPSMARMIAMNDEAQIALRRVQHLFLGGEALPGTLVRDLRQITDASVTNMYGPTETTIWSSTAPVDASEVTANIGTPLVNQQMYVLNDAMEPCPVGMPGELWIGGAGVTRGYWQRAELTSERFIDNPFHPGRMYRTGDLVTRRFDGALDYIGRADSQVKLRGYRIELGEIEATLEAESAITQAVAMVREDTPGDKRLVAYVSASTVVNEATLRETLGATLPAHMIPSRILKVDAFPLTPNRKIDRKALPAPTAIVVEAPRPSRAPAPAVPAKGAADTTLVDSIGAIWKEVLGVQPGSGKDNFFDLGGHSLLAVQAHRLMRERHGATALSITDVFRFPTLEAIATRVAELSAGQPKAQDPASNAEPANNARAISRSEAMSRRRAMRARRSA